MILQQPPQSPYDLRFRLFGFPVRVTWSFWLAAAVFGYGVSNFADWLLREDSPGLLPLLLLWAVCMLVSILIHELGHAFAFRLFGRDSMIVLYHFGGLAIPTSRRNHADAYAPLNPSQDIFVSLAGPLVQLGSAVALIAGLKAAGYSAAAFGIMPAFYERIPGITSGEPIEFPLLQVMFAFYLFPSVMWAILNLIPVWPLDGGRVMHSLIAQFGGAPNLALMISVVVGGLVGVYGLMNGQTYLGILFFVLAISNYQAMQESRGWR